MPESNDHGHSAETSPLAAPGEVKIDICRRLGDGWPDLADYVQIPSHERRQFRQGFEAQGPRWSGSERFEELTRVLARVPPQALVLLGPPGSGKSTLLRHFAMDQARAVLNNYSEAELVDASAA